MTIDAKDAAAKDEIAKRDGFAAWKNQPATRMMLNMIPTSEKPEVLEILLKETFNAGYNKGAGQTASTFLHAMFDGMAKRKDI